MKLDTDQFIQHLLRLSREERDYVAGHALDSLHTLGDTLNLATSPSPGESAEIASTAARKIAALSNLLGDIGWERVGGSREAVTPEEMPKWVLGELFPVAQLRPWLEGWVGEDRKAARVTPSAPFDESAQTKLGTGALLLARLEKWMASHEN